MPAFSLVVKRRSLFLFFLGSTLSASATQPDNPYRNVDPLGGTPVESIAVDGVCRNTKSNRQLITQRGEACYWYVKSAKRIPGEVLSNAQARALESSGGGSCKPNLFDPEHTSICIRGASGATYRQAQPSESGQAEPAEAQSTTPAQTQGTGFGGLLRHATSAIRGVNIRNVVPSMAPASTANVANGHTNSNGCTVRGDRTICPPTVAEMNNNRTPKVSPEESASRQNLEGLSVEQLWKRGSDLYASRQYGQAAGVFFRGANLHDPRAQSALGNMYDQGLGVDHDAIRALFWIGEAARAGNRGAQYMAGVYWEDGEQLPADIHKAFPWYLKSAQQGFGRAQMRVGLGYYFGDGVPANKPLGMRWLRTAQANDYGPAGVYADILANPRTPRNMTFDQFSEYVAKLQAVQTEKVLAIMRSGFASSGSSDKQAWASRANALEGQGEYSRASTCRAIGTYC
jgi:TPR repeat protein